MTRTDVEHVTCREFVEVLTDYLEGALDASERADIERHIVICRGCSNYVEQMRSTIDLLGRIAAKAPARRAGHGGAGDLPRVAGGAVGVIAYKFLREGRVGPFSGVAWPAEGEWLEATGGDGACSPRVHACRVEDLPEWLDHELWRVELDGDVRVDCGKLVADRGRLVERGRRLGRRPHGRLRRGVRAARPRRGAQAAARRPGARRAGRLRDRQAARRGGGRAGGRRRARSRRGTRRRLRRATPRAMSLGARAAPPTAPTHAAVNGFIAAAAAAFADDDIGAVARERAWQADWIATRAVLQAG